MGVKNYALKEEYIYNLGPADNRIIPAGSFVSPVEWHYVPKHVKEMDQHRWFNIETEVFCYTKYGFMPIPRAKLRLR